MTIAFNIGPLLEYILVAHFGTAMFSEEFLASANSRVSFETGLRLGSIQKTMFTIKAMHSKTVSLGAAPGAIRDFFINVANFSELMPNIESIRIDNQGVTHWQLATQIPFVGSFSERFPIVRTEESEERVEWSPFESEQFNLMKFAADFLPEGAKSTIVKITQNIELRRHSPTDLHLLAGFAGESLISKEMTLRVADMMTSFINNAKKRLESY